MPDKPSTQPDGATSTAEEEPLIRFGDNWVPAHRVWKKMETASAVADVIEHFNTHFPHLSNELTRKVVPTVRQRLKDVEVRMPKKTEAPDFASVAADLLDHMPPEDVLDELARDHNLHTDLRDLIAIAGEDAYLQALRREALEYEQNRILAEQTSLIWNEMSRPAPGGGLWNQQKVEQLISDGNSN